MVLALHAEFKPLKRHFTFTRAGKRQFRHNTVRLFRSDLVGGSVVVAVAGMGAHSAACATRLLLEKDRVAGVLCAGLAGALSDELETGDIVVAYDTLGLPCPDDPEATPPPYVSEPQWRELALALITPGQRIWSGRVVTSDRVITRAAEKRRLGRAYGALAVDMESAAAAAVAHGRGKPFLAVRAISDNAGDDLPEVLARWGSPSSQDGRCAQSGRVVPSPREAAGLVRLGLATRSACGRLADFVARFVRAASGEDCPRT